MRLVRVQGRETGGLVRGSLVRRVRHWVANRGWRASLAEALRQIRSAVVWQSIEGVSDKGTGETHPFDLRHGVDTSGLIWGERLGSGQQEEYWATGYYGISPSIFWQAMDRLGLDWTRYTFVDVGCGKGRALMLALRYPFRRAWGVELSAELAAVANQNFDRFQAEWRCNLPVEAIAGDATILKLPPGPLILYLYHPFAAPVMRKFLTHLHASLEQEPRQVYLLYVNPELGELLGESPQFLKLWDERFAMEEEDTAADRFGSHDERVIAYRVNAQI